MQIITRQEAKEKGLSRYFTGKPCKHGHIEERVTSTGYCTKCRTLVYEKNMQDAEWKRKSLITGAAWRSKNRDRINARRRALHRERNPLPEITPRQQAILNGENRYYTGKPCRNGHDSYRYISGKCIICEKEYQQTEEVRRKSALRARKNRETHPERESAKCRKWRRNNKHKVAARSSHRRKKELNATPDWVNRADIWSIYRKREEICQKTGANYNVDHYYPLQSDVICGLHVPWNLQIITAEENRAKGNKMPEEFYGPNHTMIQMPALPM